MTGIRPVACPSYVDMSYYPEQILVWLSSLRCRSRFVVAGVCSLTFEAESELTKWLS